MDLFIILSVKRGKIPTNQGLSGRDFLSLMGPKMLDPFLSVHLIKEKDPGSEMLCLKCLKKNRYW